MTPFFVSFLVSWLLRIITYVFPSKNQDFQDFLIFMTLHQSQWLITHYPGCNGIDAGRVITENISNRENAL